MKKNNIWDGCLDPYTKAWQRGVEYLGDSELLAVIIRTGTSKKNAVEISSEVLASGNKQLFNLCDMSARELMQFEGIGRTKAIQLKAVAEISRRIASTGRSKNYRFTESKTTAMAYMERMRHESTENVIAVLLNIRGRFLEDKLISVGTVNSAMISPRDIYGYAMKAGASFVIVLHNHPGGDPTPSAEDDIATENLNEIGSMVGIPLLDHIIIGDNNYYSYRDRGRL